MLENLLADTDRLYFFIFMLIVCISLIGLFVHAWASSYLAVKKKKILKPTPRPNRIPYNSDTFRR